MLSDSFGTLQWHSMMHQRIRILVWIIRLVNIITLRRIKVWLSIPGNFTLI
jgi:hypothetical protein